MRDTRGFTLVEIIISIGVLAVVSAFVMQLFIGSSNVQIKARDMDQAAMQAQAALEYYKAYGSCDPGRSHGDFLRGGVYSEEDGAFSLQLFYDINWNMKNTQDTEGFTLYLDGGRVLRGMRHLTARVIRHRPYTATSERDTEVISFELDRFEEGLG